jgi:hypothetical protein
MSKNLWFVYTIATAVLCLLPKTVLATAYADISIKDTFYPGEELAFGYRLLSDKDENVTYIPGIACSSVPTKLLSEKMTAVQANTPYPAVYSAGSIDKTATAADCQATITIIKPQPFTAEASFKILADKSMSFHLNSCKDEQCHEQTDVFSTDETIFLQYTTDTDQAIATALVVSPYGFENQLKLPATFTAGETGNYKITATAEQTGYQRVAAEKTIAVIPQHLNLPLTTQPNEKNFWLAAGAICVLMLSAFFLLSVTAWRHFRGSAVK